MQPLYKVPVIPCNLRHEETIVQIADTLNYLNNVYEDVLRRVNDRIDNNNKRVSNLMSRIQNTSNKIENLKGKKKATQVFSSSKYPAADIHKNYTSIFMKSNDKQIEFTRSQVNFKDSILLEYPSEKLKFYHVKMNNKQKRDSKNMREGLGSIPSNIESVDELFLFNTSKNPYKNYVMSDPLQECLKTRKVLQETGVVGPDAAPLSITQRAALNRSIGESYFYSPDLGNVPTIDVPLDLPDLPGIADDLQYSMELGPAIAPSVTTTPVVPDLPPLANEVVPDVSVNVTEDLVEPLPSPPKLEPVQLEEISNVVEEISEPLKLAVLPETLPVTLPETLLGKPVKVAPAPVPEFNMHANLMEAIRKAGGARNAKLRVAESKTEEKPHTANMSGNSLMDDLHAKLALRRKGISGVKKPENMTDCDSFMDRISAIIPPPLANSDIADSINTEDEWDE